MITPCVREGKATKKYLLILIGITVSVRTLMAGLILHASGIQGFFAPDTPDYVAPIPNLLRGSFATSSGPEVRRTPGYPIFLMLTGMAGNHVLLAVAFQIVLACLSVFLVYKIGLLLSANESAAVLCAGLYALEPISIFYSVLLLAEGLFTVIVLFFIYQLVKYLRSPSWPSLLWAAAALSASVYVKPVSYYLPVFTAVCLAVLPVSIRPGQRLIRAASFLAICVVVIGAWQVRNYVETGYSGFTSLSETQLYTYNAAGVLAHREHMDFFAEHYKLLNARHPEQANWSLAQKQAFQKHAALRIIKSSPLLYAKLHVRGMLTALLDPVGTDILRHLGMYPGIGALESRVVNQGIVRTFLWVLAHKPTVAIVTIAIGGITAIYYVLAIFGIPWISRQPAIFIALTLIAFYFILVVGGPAGMGRYRYPIMPIVALFAGVGLEHLIQGRHRARSVRRISTDTAR
jgi:4-amino-4-deoxy-L-arabinose transferase-like glycosyltransferase